VFRSLLDNVEAAEVVRACRDGLRRGDRRGRSHQFAAGQPKETLGHFLRELVGYREKLILVGNLADRREPVGRHAKTEKIIA